jgi:hypothetical protein
VKIPVAGRSLTGRMTASTCWSNAFYSIEQSEVWTVDAQTGDAWQNLPVGKVTHAISDALFAPDGGVYAVTDRDRRRPPLGPRQQRGGSRPRCSKIRAGGVETIALSRDRKRLALSINEDGYSRVYTWQSSAPNQPGQAGAGAGAARRHVGGSGLARRWRVTGRSTSAQRRRRRTSGWPQCQVASAKPHGRQPGPLSQQRSAGPAVKLAGCLRSRCAHPTGSLPNFLTRMTKG